MARIYLDNNATTPVLPEVEEAVVRALRLHGNPSSTHAAGRAARALLEESRERLAALLGARPPEVIFTSGGTEADNLAVLGGAREAVARGAPRRAVISSVEHPAVDAAAERLAAEGFHVARIPVDADGAVSPDAAVEASAPGIALAAVLLVQNETGVRQPVAEIFAALRRSHPHAWLHTDAVQALGKDPVHVAALGADSVAVSAHKIHGPKGVGALWCAPGRTPRSRTAGGGQERGRRTGTENLAGIAGFSAAAAAVLRDGAARARRFEVVGRILEDGLLDLPGVRRNGPPPPLRHPGTLNVSFDGIPSDLLLMALDEAGVEASAGSACASGAPVAGRVLLAMGLDARRARAAVRFSVSALTTEDDARRAVEVVAAVAARVRDGDPPPPPGGEGANPSP